MPYTESDPGSPPPLESVLPSAPSASSTTAFPPHLREDRSQLDFSSISSYSTLQKIKTMRKEEGKIEDQIRKLEKQLGMVKKEQSSVRGEIPEHPPVKFGPLNEQRMTFDPLKPKKKPRSSRSTNLYSLKLTQYEPYLICPLYRCTFLPIPSSAPPVSTLDSILLSIFQLSAQITLEQYLPVLMDLLRDEMLEKMTPTMFAIPFDERFEETIRTVAGGVLPRKGNDYTEWGTVCGFMADLLPFIFNDALSQINAAMSRSPDEPKNLLPNGDTCICALSSSLPLLTSLKSQLLVLSTSLSSQRLRNARSLDLKSWIRWIETQHTLGRFDPIDWGVFQPDSSCLPWQRKVSKSISFIQSVWDEAVGECDKEELVRPLMELMEYLGGVQLFEQGKRWRVEKGTESKSDSDLDMTGWRMLLELPYFKNESVRLEEGTPKHTKELGDTLSKTDFQKAAQYYDSAALTSLPLFTARTNAALMRLQHDTPRELERAVSDCEVVLRFEPENWKAFNRRGRAYAGLGWYKYALADLEKAVELQPGNKDFENERDRVKALSDMYRRGGEK